MSRHNNTPPPPLPLHLPPLIHHACMRAHTERKHTVRGWPAQNRYSIQFERVMVLKTIVARQVNEAGVCSLPNVRLAARMSDLLSYKCNGWPPSLWYFISRNGNQSHSCASDYNSLLVASASLSTELILLLQSRLRHWGIWTQCVYE